jgi:hypothetical protein
MPFDLLAISKLRVEDQQAALRAIAERLMPRTVPDQDIEYVEDMLYDLEELVRQRLYLSLQSAAPPAAGCAEPAPPR